MPSVGMRRSTRVFVQKNGGLGRVLRSGRRLSLESGEGKRARRKSAQNSHSQNNSDQIVRVRPGCKNNSRQLVTPEHDIEVTYRSRGRQRVTSPQGIEVTKQSNTRRRVTLEHDVKVTGSINRVTSVREIESTKKSTGRRRLNLEEGNVLRLSVHDRKRKEFPQLEEDLMCGSRYVRKLRKTGVILASGVDIVDCQETAIGGSREALDVIVESSPGSSLRFTCFLVSVLQFMRSSRMVLPGLAALICRGAIFEVFSRHGVHFMPALSPRTSMVNDIISPGFCRIFGDQPFMPLVWLDFLAAPRFFRNLHNVVFLPSLYQSHVLTCLSVSLTHRTRRVLKERKTVSWNPCTLPQTNRSGNSSVKEIHTSLDVDGFEMAGSGISTRSAVSRKIQKQKSSLRSKRANKSSSRRFHGIKHFGAHDNIKANNSGKRIIGSVGSDMVKIMDGGYCASPTLRSNVNVTYKVKRDLCNNYKAVKPTVLGSRDGMDLLSCNANVLVIDSDRCSREEGATVSLECSTSKIWHVVVKKLGLTKYIHRVNNVMRSGATNRFTRAMIWTSEDGWKLEFCDRKDWFVFKELHKECWEKNLEVDSTIAIPVPGVREVLNYDDGNHVLFSRPDSYIVVHDNEVARAFKMKTIYDIDSDDEEWLEKLNSGLYSGDITSAEHLTVEKFEKVIDILEKAAYHSHGNVPDENNLTTLCSELGEDKIITAVYQYWLKKRKQKGAAFLKVFECRPSLEAPVVEEKFLSKKTSIKKPVNRNGRDNNNFMLKVC